MQWGLAPYLPAIEGDLFVFRSQWDKMCVLCSSAACSAEISYTCGIATGQMPRPYALSPYLDTESVPVVSSPSGGCSGKTLPWSL